jgi:membrane-associated phospholipid phosphatase
MCDFIDSLPIHDGLFERLPPLDGDVGCWAFDPVEPTEQWLNKRNEFDESLRRLPSSELDVDDPTEATVDDHFHFGAVVTSQFVLPSERYAFELFRKIGSDHLNYYSPASLASLAAAFALGGVIAHSDADEKLRDALRENLLADAAHEYREFIVDHKFLGEGYILLPAYGLIAYVGQGLGDAPLAPSVGEWGERSFRAIVVGAPPLLAAQLLTGGSRPGETDHESQWRPLADDNGVSGHAFIGAIPLISAAKMSHGVGWKALFLSASMLPGLSRVTDDAHYPSQVMLGWTMAYVAATAVDLTNRDCSSFVVEPWASGDTVGIAGMWQR